MSATDLALRALDAGDRRLEARTLRGGFDDEVSIFPIYEIFCAKMKVEAYMIILLMLEMAMETET
jgi:hypothetical protein